MRRGRKIRHRLERDKAVSMIAWRRERLYDVDQIDRVRGAPLRIEEMKWNMES